MVEGPKGLAVDEFGRPRTSITDLDEFSWVRDRGRAQHDVVDEGEDGGIGADSDGEREDSSQRVAGRFAELMQCEAEVGPQVFQPAPLPAFDACRPPQRLVAERTAGFPGSLFRAGAALDKRGGTLGDVLPDLF